MQICIAIFGCPRVVTDWNDPGTFTRSLLYLNTEISVYSTLLPARFKPCSYHEIHPFMRFHIQRGGRFGLTKNRVPALAGGNCWELDSPTMPSVNLNIHRIEWLQCFDIVLTRPDTFQCFVDHDTKDISTQISASRQGKKSELRGVLECVETESEAVEHIARLYV